MDKPKLQLQFTTKSENHKVVHIADIKENTIDGEECIQPDFIFLHVLLNGDNCKIVKDSYKRF